MSFSDTRFIFIFLPLFLIAYGVTTGVWRTAVLLAGSFVFYYLGAGPAGTVLFACTLCLNYGSARWIGHCRDRGGRGKGVLILALLLDFGLLFWFKYIDFFLSAVHLALPQRSALEETVLPLGISFYTFQLASCLLDVYRGEVYAERNFLRFAGLIAAFPKIVSGPLVRQKTFGPELKKPGFSREKLEDGFTWFVVGLGLKVLIADALAPVWAEIRTIGYESISTPLAWLGALSYSLQLYFDFHGYSMMALGLGEMLGLTIPRNFVFPYTARSVSEFWRRWHVTLGAWFRDYIYIPLGGSRNGRFRMVLSLFTVWLLTGLWHGAGWNFLLWGMVHFVLILLEKLFLSRPLKKSKVLSRLYLCFVIPQTWVIFAIEEPGGIRGYFSRLYPFFSEAEGTVYPLDYVNLLRGLWPVLLAGIFLCLPFAERFIEKKKGRFYVVILLLVIFWASVYAILKNGGNPFMYVQF